MLAAGAQTELAGSGGVEVAVEVFGALVVALAHRFHGREKLTLWERRLPSSRTRAHEPHGRMRTDSLLRTCGGLLRLLPRRVCRVGVGARLAAARAHPVAIWHLTQRRLQAVHVVPSVAPVAEQHGLLILGRAADLAGVLGRPPRHRPRLLRRRRLQRRRRRTLARRPSFGHHTLPVLVAQRWLLGSAW